MNKQTEEYTIPATSAALDRGPDWLLKKRQASRESFNQSPLPPRGLHLWRYTDPAKFLTTSEEAGQPIINGIQSLGHPGGLVIDRAGRETTVEGLPSTESGLVVAPLSEAVESHHNLIAPHLYELVNSQTGKLEALNGALWHDGVFVYVPDGVTVEKPLHLFRSAAGQGSSQYFRLLVIVGRNSEITLIDEYAGGASEADNNPAFANGAVEIIGLEDSRTKYISLQRMGNGTRFYQTHRASIKQNATMLTVPLAFGSALAKQNFGVRLDGPGAESRMYGLLFGSGHQHFDNHTLHHHASSQTYSDIDLKVVLRDKSLSAYTGLIRIDQSAKTCEAYQENRNLLLNRGTRAEAIPELEILNEDVSCSHGATVGPIDPMLIFYLKSRGIPEDEAVRMVVSGFVAKTFDQVTEDLRERLTGYIATRLEDI